MATGTVTKQIVNYSHEEKSASANSTEILNGLNNPSSIIYHHRHHHHHHHHHRHDHYYLPPSTGHLQMYT
jgi:hypothetical protein